ncbi:RsmE family RNA methyltransferase, partial [Actinocorallia lasiicapitis]
MSAPVFLVETGVLDGARVLLDGPEGRHAATVKRLRAGEEVVLADGAGRSARCVVVEVLKGALELEVVERTAQEAARPRLVVVQALPKGERGELAVEVMTEAGVAELIAAESGLGYRIARSGRFLQSD